MIQKLQVIFEDDDLIVIDKPAGISVYAGNGRKDETTIVGLIRNKVADSDRERPGIVHRLDRDTSGVLIIARTVLAKQLLQQQFKARTVKKTYVALVVGHPEHERAVLDWPIGRNPKNPLKKAVVGRGRPSITEYKVQQGFRNTTLLEVYPKTGRTHQIRVHLSHLGHPVVGDKIYGKADPNLSRQFLHSCSLTLDLPGGARRTFTTALSRDLRNYLSALK